MKTNMKKSTLYLVQAALIAALYTALFYAQNLLLPGTTSAAIQFRVAEVLTVLACFTPAAIPGLTIGCVLSNLANLSSGLPLDMIFGSLATLITAWVMYLTRRVCIKKLPIVSAIMPALFNGIIVGWEIEYFFVSGPFEFVPFLICGGEVALGELAVVFILGLPLTYLIKKRGLDKYLSLSGKMA
jgi:uncharacterized membrane protein